MAIKDQDYTDGQWRAGYMPLDWKITGSGSTTIGPGKTIVTQEGWSVLMGWQCPACKVIYSPIVERCTCQASEKVRLGL